MIEELRLKNFEGYRDAVVDFTSGLNLVKGRNSTGKTTILNAVVFGLFGEIPDARPSALVSRLSGSGEMSVSIKFKGKNGESIEVLRTGKITQKGYTSTGRRLTVERADVYIESDSDLRRAIVERLGISFRRFMGLVYIGQGSLQTILKPQRDFMDSVLGINVLRELREEFNLSRQELERYEGEDVEVRLRRELVLKEEKAKSLSLINDADTAREIAELEQSVEKAGSETLNLLLTSLRDRNETSEAIRAYQKSRDEELQRFGAKSAEELERMRGSAEAERTNVEAVISERRLSLKAAELALGQAEANARSMEDEIAEHAELLGQGRPVCPTCGQKVDRNELEALIASKEERKSGLERGRKIAGEELKGLELQLSGDESALSRTQAVEARLEEALERISTGTERMVLERKALESFTKTIEACLLSLNMNFSAMDEGLEGKISAILPLGKEELRQRQLAIEEKRRSLKSMLQEKEKLIGEIAAIGEDLKLMEKRAKAASKAREIVNGFDQAIQKRREELLGQIAYQALGYYDQMTDQRQYASIRIDPEDYTVYLSPSNLTEEIAATRTGGGHQTLVSLALRLALLDTAGFRELLILDEPTTGVDSTNLPQLEQYLGEMGKFLSQMILVTHHDICEADAVNVLNVEVVGGESKIFT